MRRWEQTESGRVVHPFEPVVLAATLALIPVLLIEADVHSGGWQTFAKAANWAIWGIFAVEFVFILVVAERRMAALRAHWLDAALVMVTVPAYGQLLSSLRLARLVRLLRLLRAGIIVGRALQAERRLTSAGDAFRFAALATVLLTVVAGAAQATVDTKDFPTLADAIWWAVVTVTTVGYGDFYPTTTPGRIVGAILMLVGIGFLAVLTATIASRFVKEDRSDEAAEARAMLARIEAELSSLRAEVAESRGPRTSADDS